MRKLYLRGYNLNAAKILHELLSVARSRGAKRVVNPWLDKYLIIDQVENKEYLLECETYMSYVYDGIYYYVQLGHNPFMDCMYTKEFVASDGTISRNGYIYELPWEWFPFDNEYAHMNEEEIRTAAEALFEYLVHAPCTTIHPEKNRGKINLEENANERETEERSAEANENSEAS